MVKTISVQTGACCSQNTHYWTQPPDFGLQLQMHDMNMNWLKGIVHPKLEFYPFTAHPNVSGGSFSHPYNHSGVSQTERIPMQRKPMLVTHLIIKKKPKQYNSFGDGAATAPRPTTLPLRTNSEFSEGTQRDSSVSLNAGKEGSVGLGLTPPCPTVEIPDM